MSQSFTRQTLSAAKDGVVQTFNASGTYTPTPGMVWCLIEAVGSGAAGGGAAPAGAGAGTGGGGGGGGGYSAIIASAADIGVSQTVTVGAAGVAGAAGANAGGNGGDVSVGSLCIAKGGTGGAGASGVPGGLGGEGGVAGTGTTLTIGGKGGHGQYAGVTSVMPVGGEGGSSYYGDGAGATVSNSAVSGGSYGLPGCGGAGGISYNNTGSTQGGAGGIGYIVITEYFTAQGSGNLPLPLSIANGGTGVSNSGEITSGVWTPTLTNTANIDASVAYSCQYMRVGNIVSCSGRVDIDPTTTTTATTLGLTLPIASNIGVVDDLAGCFGSNSLNGVGGCYGDATNDRATLEMICQNATSTAYFFSFQYEII